MGPQASLKLHELLLKLSGDGAEMAPNDYPTILHASLSVPDFIADKSAEAQAITIINEACATLPLTSAASIGIACNTAHLLLDQLDIPPRNFVSMIAAVTEQTRALGVQKVGILASPNTLHSRLYHDALAKAGIDAIQPNDADIELLGTLIHSVIAGHNPAELRNQLTDMAKRLEEQGADAILLGCTELPLIGVDMDIPVVDSLTALASAMLSRRITDQ